MKMGLRHLNPHGCHHYIADYQEVLFFQTSRNLKFKLKNDSISVLFFLILGLEPNIGNFEYFIFDKRIIQRFLRLIY